MLESFKQETGTGDAGLPTVSTGVTVEHRAAEFFDHDPSIRVANVRWEPAIADRYFQINLSTTGRDLSAFKTFGFRVALKCFAQICTTDSTKSKMDFTVALVQANGNLSKPVAMAGRVRLGRPIGTDWFRGPILHSTLYSVAIPFEDFGKIDLTKVTGVRFIFQKVGTGNLDISGLTASKYPTAGAAKDLLASAAEAEAPRATMASSSTKSRPTSTPAADGNRIAIVRGGADAGPASSKIAAPAAKTVSVVLKSKRPFPFTGAFPKLTVGDKTISGGDISPDAKTITYAMPESDFAALPPGAEVSLDIQASSAIWKFGPLPK